MQGAWGGAFQVDGGQTCPPRTWALVGSSVREQRRDREGGAAGWRGRREQVLEGWGSAGQGFVLHSAQQVPEAADGKTDSVSKNSVWVGCRESASCGARRKPSSKQEGGGVGQGAPVEVERGRLV